MTLLIIDHLFHILPSSAQVGRNSLYKNNFTLFTQHFPHNYQFLLLFPPIYSFTIIICFGPGGLNFIAKTDGAVAGYAPPDPSLSVYFSIYRSLSVYLSVYVSVSVCLPVSSLSLSLSL